MGYWDSKNITPGVITEQRSVDEIVISGGLQKDFTLTGVVIKERFEDGVLVRTKTLTPVSVKASVIEADPTLLPRITRMRADLEFIMRALKLAD